MPKVLISDKMSPRAAEIFRERGVEVDEKTDLTPDQLKAIIGEYDGLAIRSATKVTAEILAAAGKGNLKVIGRAGIGVDNVDIPAATAAGIVVMNTPFGNSITTAEHAIAMMFSLARDIPLANASTHAGKWEKNRFMGVELTAKTLGIIGCGNIGAIVADRALGLKMKVVAFDPFLTPERAVQIGVEKVELEDLLRRADIITLHTPLTDATRNILNADTLKLTRKGVRIINCARGGLIDEVALQAALDSGQVAAAALDVFATEPAKQHPLFGYENVICTPHLGASTAEAQENVALQVAEQLADYLVSGAVVNALNMPSVSAEDAPKLKPYMQLAEQLGSFAGQISETAVKSINISYEGRVATLNTKPLTALVLAALLRPALETVNTVSAPAVARDRGIDVSETKREISADLQTQITVTVVTEQRTRSVSGTLFAGAPRVLEIEGVPVEAELTQHMLFVRNEDKPGFIGALGMTLGNAGVNIANFKLGRVPGANNAVCLVSVDSVVPEHVVKTIVGLPHVTLVKPLSFR
ncbi:phosphoglycerate dehydrogenase [Radicibacter daui]|uniref:phosphoglycerate dehydrogenase n=1 Tax=Radicibacter daui TaxID=3064829 RepID=UPI004046C025